MSRRGVRRHRGKARAAGKAQGKTSLPGAAGDLGEPPPVAAPAGPRLAARRRRFLDDPGSRRPGVIIALVVLGGLAYVAWVVSQITPAP